MDRNSKVKLQRHTTLTSSYGFDVSRPQFRGSFSVIQRFLIISLRNQGGKILQLQIRSESCIGGDKLITAEPPLTATSLQQPLFLGPADSPNIDSYFSLYNGRVFSNEIKLSITAS